MDEQITNVFIIISAALVVLLFIYFFYYRSNSYNTEVQKMQRMQEQEMMRRHATQSAQYPIVSAEESMPMADVTNVEPEYKMVDREPNNSFIYDPETRSIMTGTEFMYKTGIAVPGLINPAWDPKQNDATDLDNYTYKRDPYKNYDPNAKVMNVDELYEKQESDPRFIYNKCGLSCCGEQYPVPFNVDKDAPGVCNVNKEGSKYLSSNYTCTNHNGGTGCMCLTEEQVDMLQHS